MENYIKSLRAHINDHEDKIADLVVEENRQQTTIRASERELESLQDEAKRLRCQTEEVARESERVSDQISKVKITIDSLEADSAALAQASELMKGEIVKLTIRLTDETSTVEKCSAELTEKAQRHQAACESLELVQQIKEVDEQLTATCLEVGTPLMSNSNEQAELGSVAMKETPKDASSLIASCEDELLNLERSVQEIRSCIQQEEAVVDKLLSRCSEIPEMKDLEMESLEEAQKAIQQEKEQEEEYIRSLHLRIEQMKDICQSVDCSCGHTYTVKLA